MLNEEARKQSEEISRYYDELYPKEECPDVTNERFLLWHIDNKLWKSFYKQHEENLLYDVAKTFYESGLYIAEHTPKCDICKRRYDALETIAGILKPNKLSS